MIGGSKSYSFLQGNTHPLDVTISCSSISYIYPDMETAFLETFQGGDMKKSQEYSVINVECYDNGIQYVSKYSTPEPGYEPPTSESYGGDPLGIHDPYESKWLELRMSNIEHAGEGVFLNRDVEEGVFLSIYSGFVYTKEKYEIYNQNCDNNATKSDAGKATCSKYAFNGAKIVKIPPEYDQPGVVLPILRPKVCLRDTRYFTI